VFRSARPLRGVACVVISLGSSRVVPFAVPVLGAGPVTLRFDVNAQDAAKASFESECEDLRGRVAQAREAQVELVKALSRLILQGRNADALERATAGLASLDADHKELTAELEKLRKQPGAKEEPSASLLEFAGRQLEAIQADRGSIDAKRTELESAVARAEGDPVRFEREFRTKELTAQIRQLIERGEIPEALAQYDELYNVSKNEEVKEQKAKLAKEWEPKNDEHRKARDYVTGEWRRVVGLDGFKGAVAPLTDAAAVLAKNDDRLGLRNLLSSLDAAYARMKEVSDALDPNSEADRNSLKELQGVLTALRRIETDARAKLKQIEGAAGKGP
jgi:hypothetical protein